MASWGGYELGETMVGIVVRSRLVETKGGIVGRSGLVDTIESMVRHSVRGETLGASWGDPGAWARAIYFGLKCRACPHLRL